MKEWRRIARAGAAFVLGAAVFGAVFAAQAGIELDDIAAAWLFNGNAEDREAQDSSGNGFHAALHNGARMTDGALHLDGTNWAQTPSRPELLAENGFSVAALVYPTQVGAWHNFVSKGWEYIIRIDPPEQGGQFAFFVYIAGDPQGWRPEANNIVPDLDSWTYVVGTYEPTEDREAMNVKLYVDGRLEEAANRVGEVASTPNPVEIGRWEDFNYFIGSIDEAAVFTRALAAGEVDRLSSFGLENALEEARETDNLSVEPGSARQTTAWARLKR